MKFPIPASARLAFPLAALVLAVPPAHAITLYWDGVGTWTGANNWSLDPGGPFDQTWTGINNGADAVFNVPNSTITGATSIFSSITANENVTMTSGGLMSPYFTADVTVAAGKIFSFGGQNNGTGQALVGSGGIRKLGDGELVIGNANHTYTGGFTMNAGTVTVFSATALGQGGALELNGGTLQGGQGNQDFSNKFSGGITIGGDFALFGQGGGFIFNNAMFLGDATRAIDTVSSIHTFNGKISGEPGGGIIKDGGGTLVISGNNDFTGPVIINGGYLSPTHNNALGTTDGDTTINGGGGSPAADFEFLPPTLTLLRAGATIGGSDLTIAENLNFRASAAGLCELLNTKNTSFPEPRNHTLTGVIDVTSEYNSVNFDSESGSFTFIGNITGTMTFGSNLQLRGSSGNTLNRVSGNLILTGGDLVKTGSGFWRVGAPGKTYSWNNTRMSNGILQLGLANILPSTGLLIMGNTKAGTFGGSDGFLDLNGFDQTVAGITYVGGLDETIIGWTSGTRRITSATPAVLTVNNATDYSPAGNTPNTRVMLQGALGLRKEGIGKLTLSGINTHSGNTTVTAGILSLAGADSATDANTANDLSTVTIAATSGAFLDLAYTGTDEVDKLFIGGVQKAAGEWGALGSGADNEDAKITGTGTLTVATGPAGTPYDTWASGKGLTGLPGSATDPAKAADPDKDGRNNLAEFAFDGNPLSGANDGKVVGKVAVVSSTQTMTLTLPVRTGALFGDSSGDELSALIDGIYYRIEGGTDLVTFADNVTEVAVGAELTAIQAGLPLPLSSGWTYRTFRVSGTVLTQPKAFLRAKISETP